MPETGSQPETLQFVIGQSIAPDETIFAIGDVHGLSDALFSAMRVIAQTKTPPGKKRRLVLLGDLIDRGKDSLGAIDIAMHSHTLAHVDTVTSLMGNHEMMLAIALMGLHGEAQRPFMAMWLKHGGTEFLSEIGLEPGITRETLNARLGPSRVDFITAMEPYHLSGNVMFIHAGLNSTHPGTPSADACAWNIPYAANSLERHPFWITTPFLDRIGAGCHNGYFVCHGHSPDDRGRLNAYARRKGLSGPPNLIDALVSSSNYDRLNLDAGSPSKNAVRVAWFVDNRVTLAQIPGAPRREK